MLETVTHLRHVCQSELDVDDLDVTDGIDAPLDVNDVGVLETSNDLGQLKEFQQSSRGRTATR